MRENVLNCTVSIVTLDAVDPFFKSMMTWFLKPFAGARNGHGHSRFMYSYCRNLHLNQVNSRVSLRRVVALSRDEVVHHAGLS